MHGHDFGPGEVAFNVDECNRMPNNFTQPQCYAIYGVPLLFLISALLNNHKLLKSNKEIRKLLKYYSCMFVHRLIALLTT